MYGRDCNARASIAAIQRCAGWRQIFPHAYTWLSREMTERVGLPPQSVVYPVWAWYMQNGKHKKPDLRSERWDYGAGGEDCCCIELEIAPERVLLSDFDEWHIVLCNGLVSDTEEEDIAQEALYESLSDEEKNAYKEKNWERVFDTSPLNNGWTTARRMGAGDVLGTQARGCLRRALFSHRQVQSALPKSDEGVSTEKAASSLVRGSGFFRRSSAQTRQQHAHVADAGVGAAGPAVDRTDLDGEKIRHHGIGKEHHLLVARVIQRHGAVALPGHAHADARRDGRWRCRRRRSADSRRGWRNPPPSAR